MPVQVRDLGVLEYQAAHALQQELVAQRTADAIPDTLLLLEHPHVFTRGRKSRDLGNVLAPGNVPVVQVERGGDVTYHGPGQLVAYPIVKLPDGQRDAPAFIRRLEAWVIAAMARMGAEHGARRKGYAGVWCGDKKVASVGVAVTARWVTWHGIALNVSTDLSYFARINPCGMTADIMTSMERLTGRTVTMAEARTALVETWPGQTSDVPATTEA